MRPPFPYFGGKQTLGPAIADLLPAHGHYVEPFAGSLAVLLAKPVTKMETVNDLSGDLMTFWRVLRDQPDELERVCLLTPHSRGEYEASFGTDPVDDVERARRVWVKLSQSRSALFRHTGWRNVQNPEGSPAPMPVYLAGYVGRIQPCAARLRHVTLECRDALDVIRDYGKHEGVLIYADPPYLGTVRTWGNNYQHEIRSDDEHSTLAAALHDCRATVVLSGYHSPLYDELYADWNRVELAARTSNATDGDQDRTEVLWSNKAFTQSDLTLFSEGVA